MTKLNMMTSILIRLMVCLLILAGGEKILANPVEALPVEAGTIRGKVTDAKTREPMQFVNISVRKTDSSVPLKGIITDETGNFSIAKIPEGDYILSISFIGYKTVERKFILSRQTPDVNFRNIPLEEDSQLLNEVKVTGQRPQMKFEIDKKVFNVDQNISSTGGTASDVLSNIPSVEVDNEGEVSLRGNSDVTVWINGRASGLSADNRAQILEQLPAESIERIEVITNPSAKYSPEGTSGIINIVLKEDRRSGYYGSAQAGADTRGGWNLSGNINYTMRKAEMYAGIGYRERKRDGGGYSNRINIDDAGKPVSFLNQISDNSGDGGQTFVRAGLTWHLTSADHLNFAGFGMFGKRNQTNTIDYTSDVPGSFISSRRITDSDNPMQGGNVELGYKHDFSKTSYIDIVGSWNTWNMDQKSTYLQYSLFSDDRETHTYQWQRNKMQAHTWEVQADYVNAFSDFSKIEAGYKGTFSRQNSPVETYSGETATDAIPDEQLYNRFYYDQDIQAMYATYSGRFGDFGYQAGLRGEYSHTNSRSLAYGQNKREVSPYKNDYFSFFPSIFLTYNLPGNNEIQVNYTRRISRPWSRQLNPFQNLTDSTNISFGNPHLTPQYSNAMELNYIKNWDAHTLTVSAYYRNTNDVIQRISYLEDNIMKTTYENVAKTQSAGTEIIAKNKLFDILDLTTTINLYYSKLDGFEYLPAGAEKPVTGESNENFSWNAKVIANIALPAAISLQLTGNYNSRQLIAQGHQQSNHSLDAGLRRAFLNRKLSLSINGRDLLNSRKWKTETSGQNFTQYASNWRTGRTVGFTLTYNFGNMMAGKGKNQRPSRDHETPGMMNEMEEF